MSPMQPTLMFDGITFHELYVTESDVEGYMLAQRLNENKIDNWTGGREGRYVVVCVPWDRLDDARVIRVRMFGS